MAEKQPLLGKNVVDGSASSTSASIREEDSFILMLPKDLQNYVVRPIPGKKMPFTNFDRSLPEKFVRGLFSVLLFPYACCKMVLVKEGEVALTWNGAQPEVLGAGRHVLLSPTNQLDEVVPIARPIIRHGPIFIIRVKVGEIGYGMDTATGRPVLLTHGEHYINSPTFQFNRIIRCSEEDINLAPYRLIRVNTGSIGFVYRQGELQILQTGQLHLIGPADEFGGFLSLQQDVISIPESAYDNCDYVPLIIKADVFYEICDPEKVIARISGQISEIRKIIRESAIATLASIIRGSSLADIAQTVDPSYHQAEDGNVEDDSQHHPASSPNFQATVHDHFMQVLASYFKMDFGIQLNNIRIESLALQDPSMRKQLAGQAATSVQNQSALKNVENKRRLQEAEITMMISRQIGEVQAGKESEQIGVKADAANMVRKAKAEGEALTISAKSAANAIIIRAEAEAKALELIGKAKAESEALLIKRRGEAEAEAAHLLDQTQLGPKLALSSVRSGTLKDISKIMYLTQKEGDIPSLLTSLGTNNSPHPAKKL